MAQVFISYSRKDLSFVEQLAADLKKAGFDVWYDFSRLEGGSRWRAEIEKAIRNSQYVIVVLSPDSVESEWVESEFLFASNLGRKIIPLLYQPCELPLGYLGLNYIDVQEEKYQENFNKLLRVLSATPAPTALPPSKTRKPASPIKLEYIVAIIVAMVGALATICAALLGLLPGLGNIFAPQIPTATETIEYAPNAEGPVFFTDTAQLEPTVTVPATDTLTPTRVPPTPTDTPTPTATPYPHQITDSKGVELVLVAEDTFPMGGSVETSLATCVSFFNPCKRSDYENQEPVHDVYLADFYIDKYEVTNDSYKSCVNAGICAPPVQTSSASQSNYYGEYNFRNFPVIFVDWNMANRYCEWRGARLPTEAEWEKAARGTDGRTYPWGEGIDCSKANYIGCRSDTTNVGSFESDKSPYGAYDMGGNVIEWVADWYSATYYQNSPSENPQGSDSGENRVVRGGSWSDLSQTLVPLAYRSGLNPSHTSYVVGFRCALSP